MAVLYHQVVSPRIVPLVVEERFEIWVPGVGIPIVGYVDVIDGAQSPGTILDTKTIDKLPSSPLPTWKIAASVYMLAYPGRHFAWHAHSKDKGEIATSDSRPSFKLRDSAQRRATAELMVRRAYESMIDLHSRYGSDEPWPGVGVAHKEACGLCAQRKRCVWLR